MAPITNGRILFNSIPEVSEFPEPGKAVVYDTSERINLETVHLNGGFLLKTLDLSIDPYMRVRMREPETKSYMPAFLLNQPLDGHGVGVVLRSELPEVKAGDHLYGFFKFVQYDVRKNLEGLTKLPNEHKLPWSVYVGAAGMPGQTAYMGWKEYSQAKKGQTVFVSTGAGPVGSLVIQLAKADGLKVIGSAGSDEKIQFMKECGADVAFNYKTTNTKEVLQKEGPIDIFWDNVGGETLEAALDAANVDARFIECGMISGYNSGGAPVRNLFHVVTKSISMHGFGVNRLESKYAKEFYETVPRKLGSGELKHREHVFNGLDKVGEALFAVQTGMNKAKTIIKVADE